LKVIVLLRPAQLIITMPRLGGSLSCFYCGKKSSVKFDGSIRDFLCLHCDATNYLDKV
jgi:hypothetical protein